jgi:hypothetical protein
VSLDRERALLDFRPGEHDAYVRHADAAIGENPRLFGFQFDNPLGFVEKSQPAARPAKS